MPESEISGIRPHSVLKFGRQKVFIQPPAAFDRDAHLLFRPASAYS
jgi:hypothetical protein